MKNSALRLVTATCLVALVSGIPAVAQSSDASDMSADQLKTIFQKQKTRGLVIAPSSNATPAAATTADVQQAQPAAPATLVELPPEEQVNIQISFDFDSSALRPDQKPKLATLCEVLKTIDIQVFRIVGHTDASGSDSYNQQLSQLRAEEVKRHLVSDCGIAPERLEAVGAGEQYPYDKDNPNADVNRRVEFQALS